MEESEEQFTDFLLDDLEQAIIAAGPSTVAMVIMEPVQNAGGAFTPPADYFQGVREICDRYGILLCADEVITGFGRLGEWFGSAKYDIKPDLITSAKGLSSAYAAIGAVIAADHVYEPFLDAQSMYTHGITFGGHPVMCAIALKNIEIMKRERIVENVRDNGDAFRDTLAQLLDLDIVGDLRGTGFFYALELVKDKETREGFSDEDSEVLLRGFLSPRLFERGLICRADDRGDPVVQISPPLIATQAEFDEITGILGDVLADAQEQMHVKAPALSGDAASREPGTRIPCKSSSLGPGASARPSPRSRRAATSSSGSCSPTSTPRGRRCSSTGSETSASVPRSSMRRTPARSPRSRRRNAAT
jgi:adenosylmethionine-8-amino-7-oxononanoate aminotransferase